MALRRGKMKVEQKVITIIADIFKRGRNELTLETGFIEDLHAKSVQIIELIALLEDEFDISIPFVEAKKNRTIGEAVKYVENKLKNK